MAKKRSEKLGHVQESALDTMIKLDASINPVPTHVINQNCRQNVTSTTMRSLEVRDLVELCGVHHFKKAFHKVTKKPVSRAERMLYDKDELYWKPDAKSYSWKLTSKAYRLKRDKNN